MPNISLFEALFNPWITLFWLLILWVIFHLLFLFIKISDKNLKRVELSYLLIGFIGIISIVFENKQTRIFSEQEYIKLDIQHMAKQIQFHYRYFCFEYTKSPSSPIDFDDREIDQKILCEWGKKEQLILNDTINGVPQKEINIFEKEQYQFHTDNNNYMIEWYNRDVGRINELIQKYKQNEIKLKSDPKWFFKTIGTLLLLLALSLRLAITSFNLRKIRK